MTDLSEGGIEVDCGISAGPSLSIFWLDRFEGGRDCLSVSLSVRPSIYPERPLLRSRLLFCVPRWLEKWSEASACLPGCQCLPPPSSILAGKREERRNIKERNWKEKEGRKEEDPLLSLAA